MPAAEGAEPAVLDADVGEVDVAVDHVGHRIAHGFAAQVVGRGEQREQLVARRLQQARPLGHRDLVAGESALQNRAHLGTGQRWIGRGAAQHREGGIERLGHLGPQR